MTYRTVTLGFGAFFTVAAFVCLLVALCTNQWVIIQVDRSADSTLQIGSTSAATLAAFTRYRGIFKECYDDKEATKPCMYDVIFAILQLLILFQVMGFNNKLVEGL